MRRWLAISLLFLAAAIGAAGQNVTISGQVLDPRGNPYYNGNGRANLVSGNGSGQQNWLIGTSPVPTTIIITGLDSTGRFSTALPNTSLISPQQAAPQWQFQFNSFNCPPSVGFSVPSQPFTANQNITSLISSYSVNLPPPCVQGPSGATPGCSLFDIQLNYPLGAFGGDCGLWYEDPTRHLANLGSPSVGGTVVVQGPSDGTVNVVGSNAQTTVGSGYVALKTATAPVPSPGAIGVGFLSPSGGTPDDWVIPPTAVGTIGQAWGIIGVSGDIVQSGWITPASSGSVSCENWWPAWYCNANAPATTNDITPTPFDQQPITVFRGPPLPTDPATSVRQTLSCTIGDSMVCQNGNYQGTCTVTGGGNDLTCAVTLGTLAPGETGYVEIAAQCGLGCVGNTYSISDTNAPLNTHDTFTQMVNSDGSGASMPASSWYFHSLGGQPTITVVLHGHASNNYRGVLHFTELFGTVVPDQFAYNGSSVSGAPTIQPVTTTNATDTLLLTYFANPVGGSCTFTAGSGYEILQPYINGTVYSSVVAEATEAQNVVSTGTYTPTISTSCTGIVGAAFTTAFTTDVFGSLAPFYAGLIDLPMLDYVGGPIPNPSTGSAGYTIVVDSTGKGYTLAAASGGSVTGSGTTNKVPKWTAGTVLGDSSLTDTGSALSTTEPFTAASLATSPGGGVGGGLAGPEGTAPSTIGSITCPSTGNDCAYWDSTAHGLKLSLNNGAFFTSLANFSVVNLASTSAGGVTGTLPTANGGTGSTTLTFPAGTATIPQTIATGATAMGTSAINSGTCATVVTVSATGVATTDVISATPNADPTGVTGYAVSATGSLYIVAYPTSGNVNFKVCNNTSGTLTPSALTMNWRVTR